MSLLRRSISMEEEATGQAIKEIEHVYYGRLANAADLQKAASSEHQEQWEIKVPHTEENAGDGCIRIRKTITSGGQPEYTLTTKVKTGNEGDKIELTIPTTEQNFTQFKILSESGMRKDRYFFPVEGTELVWEVDMFYAPGAEVGSAQYLDWCKVDLEVKNRSVNIPELPLQFQQIITAPYGKRTADEEAQVSGLYENGFKLKNEYRSKQPAAQPVTDTPVVA